MTRYTLPYPPSVNHYYRHVGARVLISSEGRKYREAVWLAVLEQGRKRHEGPVSVELLVSPPDKRRRDLDNVLKGLLDALAHAGVYEDDSQIDSLTVKRGRPGSGSVTVYVDAMPAAVGERWALDNVS